MDNIEEDFEENNEAIKTISQYLERINSLSDKLNGEVVFRGQGKTSYEITPSAARRLKFDDSDPDEELDSYIAYNCKLISNAKMKSYHHKGNYTFSDIELLAELQHHGAATGLIDFTRSSLIALYFATINIEDECISGENNDDWENGVVYLLNIGNFKKFKKINDEYVNQDFEKLVTKDNDFYWVWEPSDINNRIPKQHSLFIFGKPKLSKDLSLTVEIDKNSKLEILKELEKFHNINDISLFSDLSGFAKANSQEKPFVDIEFQELLEKAFTEIFENKNYEKAESYLYQARIKNRFCQQPLALRAMLKLTSDNYEGALKDYNKIISLFPNVAFFYFSRGQARHHLEDYDGALEDYKKAEELGYNSDDDSLEIHIKYAIEKKEPPKLKVKETTTVEKEFFWE